MENRVNRQKKYHFKKIHDKCLYVIANDAIRLDGLLEQVNNDVRIKNFNGRIIFDMLIVNGNNNKRYFQSLADINGVNIKSLSALSNVPNEIVKVSNNYIRNHIGVLEHGTLSQYEIQKIKESIY